MSGKMLGAKCTGGEKNRTRKTGGSNLGRIDGIQQMSGSNLERTKSRQQVTDQTVQL